MAVTEEKSAIVTRIDDEAPQDLVSPRDWLGRLRFIRIDFTQGSAAGDANSTLDLAYLPQGRVAVVGYLSRIFHDAFGSGRTLDIGHTGYTQRDGTSKSAVVDFFADGKDVSSAGNFSLDNVDHDSDNGLDLDQTKVFDSRDRILVQGKCLGATLPATTKVWGHLAVVVD